MDTLCWISHSNKGKRITFLKTSSGSSTASRNHPKKSMNTRKSRIKGQRIISTEPTKSQNQGLGQGQIPSKGQNQGSPVSS